METLLALILWFYLFLAAYFVVKESIFHCRKKKIVPGALYYYWPDSTLLYEIKEYDSKALTVIFKPYSTKDRPRRLVIHKMEVREFLKCYKRVKSL